jgi:hypothetical protein
MFASRLPKEFATRHFLLRFSSQIQALSHAALLCFFDAVFVPVRLPGVRITFLREPASHYRC